LPCSFNINPDLALNSLVGDANDVTLPEQRKQTLRNTKKCKILNILYILYYVLYISYYDFDEYSLVLVLNRMSKRMKSVTKNSLEERVVAGRCQRTPIFRVVVLPVDAEQR
jgi:hypothetical protein